jgi:hypothetical protein
MSTRILALVGSLRAGSCNRQLAEAAVKLAPEGIEVEIYDVIAEPATVPRANALRAAVGSADELLMVTPRSRPAHLRRGNHHQDAQSPDRHRHRQTSARGRAHSHHSVKESNYVNCIVPKRRDADEVMGRLGGPMDIARSGCLPGVSGTLGQRTSHLRQRRCRVMPSHF